MMPPGSDSGGIISLHRLSDVLAWLDDGEHITVTMHAETFHRAMEMADGGPEIMSTPQAARRYGWTSRRWRQWAEAGDVSRAWRDDQGNWRLPKESCRRLVEEQQARGSRPSRSRGAASSTKPVAQPAVAVRRPNPSNPPTQKASIRRGPRKPKDATR
jgi:hypothetical protein